MRFHPEHLQAAWHQVQRGSPAAGIDDVTVELFAGAARQRLHNLHNQLQRERYYASPAKGFMLRKKSGGHRLIGLPTVRDRIVQRYLLQSVYPRFEQVMSDSAFAYRPGFSIYDAVEQVMQRYQYQPAWVLKADIQQFFDNLSWALLLTQLEKLELAPELIALIEQQLKSGLLLRGRFYSPGKGVLQGGVLSGALANLYLHEFDQHCLAADIPLVRYGDDCLAVFPDYLQAHRAQLLMQDWIADLYLHLHPEKTCIIPPGEPFTFLGHNFHDGEVDPPPWQGKQESKTAQKKKALPPSGPPKVCSIVRANGLQKRRTRPLNVDEYWRDSMTTLYVTEQGSYLRVKDQQFQVMHQRELRCAVPASRVTHVVLFGCCNVSHGAVGLALRRRIPILYLASNGRYFGRLETEGHAQIEYLTQQVYRAAEPEFSVLQARQIIAAKLHNSRVMIQRLNRKRKTELGTKAIGELALLIPKVEAAEAIESMLGFEGQGASLYFRAYASLLKGEFAFEQRTRRPPQDPVNSLLSLGYTLLSQNLHSMVEAAGLHTHFGHIHKPQKNRPSLVCDLVEEFRALVVDALVGYLINSNIFTLEDFTPPDARGGVYLFPDSLKTFLGHWEKKLLQEIVHPHTGHRVSYRRCFELQVWEYVHCLMGEQPLYRPMRWER